MDDKPKIKLAWLEGSYLRRRELLVKIDDRFKDSEKIVCRGDMSMDFFLSEIETVSCFDEKRLIIVHDMPIIDPPSAKIKSLNALKSNLESLPDNSFIVFNGIDSNRYKTIYNIVKSIGKIYEFEESIEIGSAVSWVSELFSEMGYKILPETASYLIEHCGWDKSLGGDGAIGRDLLELTCRGLAMFSGTDKEITIDHIVTSAFESEQRAVWNLSDALDERDFDECLRIVAKETIEQDSAIKAISGLFSFLSWRYRMIFFLEEMLKKTNSVDESIQEACQMRKFSQTGSGEYMKMRADIIKTGENKGQISKAWNIFVIGKIMNQSYGKPAPITLYSRKELFRIIQILTDTLFTLRHTPSDEVATLMSDVFFMAVCNKVDDKLLAKLRYSLSEPA